MRLAFRIYVYTMVISTVGLFTVAFNGLAEGGTFEQAAVDSLTIAFNMMTMLTFAMMAADFNRILWRMLTQGRNVGRLFAALQIACGVAAAYRLGVPISLGFVLGVLAAMPILADVEPVEEHVEGVRRFAEGIR